MLRVENLSFSYDKIQAIRNVSFELQKGEIMAIVGANGAGKSSLMKCIAGLLKPQCGEVYLNDKKMESAAYRVVESGVSLVPEGRWIFPNLTVEENLLLGGYTSRNRAAGVERSFAEALDKQEEVLVFAKLPSAFKIDTPLGSYNPDWAYVEEADGERRVYFVTETKGGKNGEPALRDAEKIKIGCAKKHFEALDLGNDFHYNVRTTYQYEAVKA